MHLFFRFVAQQMTSEYEARWHLIQHWLNLSLCPRSIEYNLLGFGQWEKIQQRKSIKSIRSPMKPSTNSQDIPRSSYASFENSLDHTGKNLIVVFEATTAKINFVRDVQRDLQQETNQYSNSMKTFVRKLAQLERQIFYLSHYYSVEVHQFFAGLILFEFYRNPTINPDQLLRETINSENIRTCFPLIVKLFEMDQFVFTY